MQFHKNNKLTSRLEYKRIFNNAIRSQDDFFIVLYNKNDNSFSRLGLAISKKYCRLATKRNKIKRIIRESFRQNQDKLIGIDLIVLNKKKSSIVSNKKLFNSLKNHWKRCAILKNKDRRIENG